MIIYLIRHGKNDDSYRGGWSDLGLLEDVQTYFNNTAGGNV